MSQIQSGDGNNLRRNYPIVGSKLGILLSIPQIFNSLFSMVASLPQMFWLGLSTQQECLHFCCRRTSHEFAA